MPTDLAHPPVTAHDSIRTLLSQAWNHSENGNLFGAAFLAGLAYEIQAHSNDDPSYTEYVTQYVLDVIDLNDGDGLLEAIIHGLASRRR